MIKSEPKSILQFMATHYSFLRDIFDLQINQGFIDRDGFYSYHQDHHTDIEASLLEFQILIEQNDDFVFNEPYLSLFEFIHQRFKPLLPEEIEQYGTSIRELFLHIREGISQDKNILLDRIDALAIQIKNFRNAIVNNTKSLLSKSRELKANTQKIEYEEKIQQASFLIENYILPLNSILDINHSQSIYNELLQVSQFSNARRFDYGDENIRRQFEKLYHSLRQTQKDLNEQSVIISNELLPLMERIRTESQYLRGIHHYLTNGRCYKNITPPPLFLTGRHTTYHPFIRENTLEYIEQFKHEEEVILVEEGEQLKVWIFDKNKFKTLLDQSIPIDDFFGWCYSAIKKEKNDFSADDFFTITGLLFEEDYDVEVIPDRSEVLSIDETEWTVPRLKIKSNENVS